MKPLAVSCLPVRTCLRLSGVVALMIVSGAAAHGADTGQELGRIKIKPLQEVSGIAASRRHEDVLWMHNDGEAKHVFAVKTSGKVAAQVKIPEAVEDVEDMAIGPGPEEGVDYLYLGDIGDNDGDRREVRVVRFAEPSLDHERGQPKVRDAEVIRLQYPDGPHDAEALLVDPMTGDLIIVTKEDRRRARLRCRVRRGLSDQVSHVTLEELGGAGGGTSLRRRYFERRPTGAPSQRGARMAVGTGARRAAGRRASTAAGGGSGTRSQAGEQRRVDCFRPRRRRATTRSARARTSGFTSSGFRGPSLRPAR